MTYFLSEAADADVAGIIAYIADYDEAAALRLYRELLAAFRLLGRSPHIGHRRPDLTARELRFWTVRGNWMITHFGENPVEVVAVLDARRDLVSLLR